MKPPLAVFKDEVIAEIDEIARYIARDNLDAGVRFFEAVEGAFALLAENPGIGAPRRVNNLAIDELRYWLITGFENYVVFYLPHERGGIRVLHVLHGARNIDPIISRDFR